MTAPGEVQVHRGRGPISWQQWLVAAYSVLIEVWLFVHFVWADRFWPVAIVNTVAFYLFLPLPLLALLAALSRKRRFLLGLLLFPVLIFLGLFGELFLPRLAAEPHGTPLTVMTYNVLNSNRNVEAISASILAGDADLVGLQELTDAVVTALPSTLGAEYPYQALALGDTYSDVGLLSRYPILSVEQMTLPPRNLALRAVVDVNGQRVRVYVVHLSPNNFYDFPLRETPGLAAERYASRAAETAQLRAELKALQEPIVLMCDCNLTDTSAAYRTLRAVLGDSFREAGWGLGHTLLPQKSPMALQRIDYVWHSDDFYVVAARVGQAGGSDHRPVWADMVWLKRP